MHSTKNGSDELYLHDKPIGCEIVIEGIPPSLKNSRRNIRAWSARTKRQFTKSIPSQKAVEWGKKLQAAVREALIDIPLDEGDTLWGDDNLTIVVEPDGPNNRTRITVMRVGPRKGWRKFDVQNTIELPCDALQGLLYDDDKHFRDAREVHSTVGEEVGVRWIYPD